jgi:hypothetical protein
MTARQPASGANDHAAERDAHTLRAERVAVSVGFGIIALLLFCQALAMSETVAVLSPRTAWAILFAAIPILVFGLLAFTARPVRLRATLRTLGHRDGGPTTAAPAARIRCRRSVSTAPAPSAARRSVRRRCPRRTAIAGSDISSSRLQPPP